MLNKILILWAFYSPRPGDFKTFLFLFWDLYFLNILALKFGIPCIKVLKFFFLNIVIWRMMYQKSVLEHWTLITNQFRKMSINVRLTCEKPCILENFRILQFFLLSVQSIFKIFKKWFDICVLCLNARFLNRHKAILKLYYRGSQTLKPEYSRNIGLRKKIRTVLKSPGRGL